MRTTTVYRDVNGTTVKEDRRPVKHGTAIEPDFNKRMQRSYHEAECELGSRFRPQHSVAEIKRAWF